jgi:EmrB/QacA subfamily drug resistance transporter
MRIPQYQQVLFLVSAGVFMSTMDSSMLNVALPVLMKVFASSLAATEWVVLVYLLTITVSLLFWGYFSNTIGQGKLYWRGVLIFTLGSLLCTLAPSIGTLIVFRLVQATGASMMMAMGPALIKSSYPPEKLGQGLGLIGIATSLGLMSGPVISGLLLRWAHWRFIFLVTVPVGLFLYIAGGRLLRNLGRPDTETINRVQPHPFDRAGGLFYVMAVILTVLPLSHATTTCCQGDGMRVVKMVLPALFWMLFVWWELRCPRPLLPVRLFASRFYAVAMICAMFSFVVLFFVLLLMPFYLSKVRGYPPDQVGWFMMSVPLCVFFVAPLAGHLHDRIGARIIATLGLALCLVSLVLLTHLEMGTSPSFIVAALALLGFGQPMFHAPNSASALSGVPHEKSGITASLLATSRNMGMLFGTALAGFIFAHQYAALTGGMDIRDFTGEHSLAFIHSLRRTFQAGILLAAVAVLLSIGRGSGKSQATE